MAAQFSTIQVVGTLGRDSELGYTPQGSANLKFSIASDVGKGDDKRTRWFNVTLWGKQAETMQQYLTKGKMVAVAGDFDFRTYTKKDGGEGYSLDINANKVQLLGGRDDDAEGGANVGNGAAKPKTAAKKAAVADEFDFGTDDVPF